MPKSPQNGLFRIGLYLGWAGTRPCAITPARGQGC
ncbi:hypothetical protein F383_15481 [Gossypium arboreum]|uniref:Uncharacterized protein n=1 Tax=Gossypium arboreum TaxID=29729 RepID=A0A0B0NB09_GOSAR|nr:hypothetical protein F383_15481 [Gossypium arboreum]